MSEPSMYITMTQTELGVELEQRTILDNMKVDLVIGGGLSRVNHSEDFDGDGTVTDPLKLSEEFVEKVDSKQDQLTAGTGIVLEDNIISGDFATNTQAGIIKIATDEEAETSAENVAVNPKQLSTKITKNSAITPGTSTKITYDSKGLVTGGTTLSTEDIPDISATYVANTRVGVASGVAELGLDGKVPTSQLPSYVDDVIDSYIVSGSTALSSGWLSLTEGGTALTPESGKIYVVLTQGEYQNKTYRWSGSTYVEIASSPGQATETQAGIAEIATTAEVESGVDDTRIVTPLKLHGEVSKYLPLTGGKITGILGIESPTNGILAYPALRDTSGVSWQLDIGSVLKSNNQWTANRWRFGNYAFTYEGDVSYPCIGSFQKPFSIVYTKRLNSGEGEYNTLTVPNKQGTLATLDDIPHIQLSTMPTATADYLGKIVQFVGTTDSTYTNGYFYKCTSEEVVTTNSVEFTPREGTTTIVTCDPDDFAAFITSTCAENPQWESDGTDVTHGHIGIYSSTLYSFSMYSDEGVICAVSFPIVDLEAAGFTFTPPFGAQQGVDYTCTIGTTTTVYSWEQVDVQPDPDLSGYLPLTGGIISGDLSFLNPSVSENHKVTLRQNWITWGLNVQIPDGTVYAIDQYGIWGSNGVKTLGLRGNRWRNVYTYAISSSATGENLDITVPHISGKMGVQLSTIPVAAEEYLGHTYQYVGTTDSTYTNGYFYKCVSDGEDPATYSWVRVDVQPAVDPLPSQSGNEGRFLVTDGYSASWDNTVTTYTSATNRMNTVMNFKSTYGSTTSTVRFKQAPGATTLYIEGGFTPTSSRTRDLGSSTYRWRYLYTRDINIEGYLFSGGGEYSIPQYGSGTLFGMVSSLPTPEPWMVGTTLMYSGATDSNYTHGYIYTCEETLHESLVATLTSGTLTDVTIDYNTFMNYAGYPTSTVEYWLTYTNGQWDTDPAAMGVSYSGTPTEGTSIHVVYSYPEYGWVQTNVQPAPVIPDPLPSQTGNAGKFLTTNGTSASWSDKPITNSAEQSSSIGIGGSTPSTNTGYWTVSIGSNTSVSGSDGVVIGSGAGSTGNGGLAIGPGARVTANHAIQISAGERGLWATNNTANTVNIYNGLYNYRIMNSDGTIPSDRLTKAINKYSSMPTASAANEGWIVQYRGATDSNYTHGYIYESVETTTASSATASQITGSGLTDFAIDTTLFDAYAAEEFGLIDYTCVFNYYNGVWTGIWGDEHADLSTIGITFTGTPVDGDDIEVVYTAESTSHAWVQTNVQPLGVTSVNGNSGDVTITASSTGALPTTGGTLTGNLELNGSKLSLYNSTLGKSYYIESYMSGALRIGTGSNASNGDLFISTGTGNQRSISFGDQNGGKVGSAAAKFECVYTQNLSNGSYISVPTTGGTMVVADYTSAQQGNVLTLDSNGKPVWSAPGAVSVPTLTWYTVSTAGSTLTIADTSSAQLVKVYKNGLLLEPTADYSISGTTLTTVTALGVGDKIAIEVF